MSEFFKKNGILIVFVVCMIAAVGTSIVGRLDRERVSTIAGINHIEIVKATDKNCNDCHLGASFVNLFNHPAVKNDNNTVFLMLDKAKIKRW
jgi:hypothetical protein